jgi:fructose-1,6-bisphosphatase III
MEDWYHITLYRLIMICRVVCSKYTRSKVRKALPKDFAYVLEELLHEQNTADKGDYYIGIIKTIIQINRADAFIIALSKLIQKLSVDRLHILGDIFDRGPGPDVILNALKEYNSVDIQWGNHDMLWMGAAAGSEVCMANVIRIAARYSNLDTIKEGYGINILPLATFAMDYYKDDPCENFIPKNLSQEVYSEKDTSLTAKMHKAISIIQFKLEAAVIKRRFYEEMKDRIVLEKIDYSKGTINIYGREYKLRDTHFPTINPENPNQLIDEEIEIIQKLRSSFLKSEKLQKHIQFIYAKGSMYKIFNSNLLFHGCIPLEEDGSFKKVKIGKEILSGKACIDKLETLVIDAYFKKHDNSAKLMGLDYVWYLWTGACSPLFGKNKITTFERYFISDKEAHIEDKNPYYNLRDNENICNNILKEFGLNPNTSHIINGHTPIIKRKGESPVKANGKMLVIDGGLSKAYQSETGLAGYTLRYNSHGLFLTSHEPFESIQKAIDEETDIVSSTIVLEEVSVRKRVSDTDTGKAIKEEIQELLMLLSAYRQGLIKEI